ncbi:hypothetical protein MXB_3747 [Myxobolus squamalis]|nr:hypothetical protein MXB_3747 [Myxobolus squamalis]
MSKSFHQLNRHNAILDTLSNLSRKSPTQVTRVYKIYPFGNSKLRPDLLVLNNEGSRDLLIDVVVSFDNQTFQSEAFKDKIYKYSRLTSLHLPQTSC